MKKFIKSIALILCLATFAFMALASSSSSGTKETKAIVKDDAKETKNDTEEVVEETTSSKKEVTIEAQEILNIDELTITAEEYIHDTIWGDGIKLLIENKSDRNIMVGCSALIVNDYMINDLFATDVAAGKNAYDNLYFLSNELEASGIDKVGKIEVYFHIYDNDTYETIYDTECIEITTSEVNNMSVPANDDGIELYNADGIKIIGKTVDENSFWGTAILLYIENTSDKNVTISAENMSINNFMMTPIFSCTVYSNKMAIDDITIFSSELEENGITSIDEVSLTFHIFDADTYRTICDTDEITFSAQ